MALPQNSDEFLARFSANQKIDGFGAETAMHVPCPFCAAPEFTVYKPFDMAVQGYDATMGKVTTCSECGRSGKTIVTQDQDATTAEFVQTAGLPAPWYLVPPPRLVPEPS